MKSSSVRTQHTEREEGRSYLRRIPILAIGTPCGREERANGKVANGKERLECVKYIKNFKHKLKENSSNLYKVHKNFKHVFKDGVG